MAKTTEEKKTKEELWKEWDYVTDEKSELAAYNTKARMLQKPFVKFSDVIQDNCGKWHCCYMYTDDQYGK